MLRLLLGCLLMCGVNVAAAQAPLVILLSWDGMRHDYPDKGRFPALRRMINEGLRAQRLTPVYPSTTFPGHVSLATGAPPWLHGILDNRFNDRRKGVYDHAADADWINAEPLWIAAERQGLKAATYFWVGSETDWRGQRQSYRMAPFDEDRAETQKVARIIQWLDLPAEQRPSLIMCYWAGADSVAHRRGPDHPDVVAQIAAQDRQLGALMQALDQRNAWTYTTLILVSDHGMATVGEGTDITPALEEAGIEYRGFGGSAVKHLFLKDPRKADAAVKALANLPLRAYTRDTLPARLGLFHPDRTGDVVLISDLPHHLTPLPGWERLGQSVMSTLFDWYRGMHGFDPRHPDMGAILLARGRGIPAASSLPPVDMLDVAPTVAALLNIDPPEQSMGDSFLSRIVSSAQSPVAERGQ